MTHEDAQEEVRAVLDSINEAMRRRDAAGVLAHHSRDAVVYDLAPPLASDIGTDAAKLGAWMETWEGPIEQSWRDLEIRASDDLAFCHGFLQISAIHKASGQSVAFWMRATLGLARMDGRWRIVHDHTSVPFYMDGSFRAAVDLAP